MPLAHQIATAVAEAPTLAALQGLAATLWKALAGGALTDDEAHALSLAVEGRKGELRPLDPRSGLMRAPPTPRPPRPRSPDRWASIERRRRQAASGAVPPQLAVAFTMGELAALAVVGREAARAGRCDWPMDKIAAVAGVCRTTVRNALRAAQRLGLLRVEERRQSAWRSLPNVVTVTAASWWGWLKRGARAAGGRVQEVGAHDQGIDLGGVREGLRKGSGGGLGRPQAPRATAPPGQ